MFPGSQHTISRLVQQGRGWDVPENTKAGKTQQTEEDSAMAFIIQIGSAETELLVCETC